ncbi:MAG: DUF4038 domain-containing protein, partial [Bacteroidota bacterium]
DAEHYIKVRKDQDFNLLGISAIHGNDPINYYGDVPFKKSNGIWDPAKPLLTKGKDPEHKVQYDYWDHLDYILELTEAYDMYVALVICFNSWVAGSGNGANRSQIVFNEESAYAYGYFIGNRYRGKQNILWMMGGDRSAVYGEFDYTGVYRAMAEGVADGIKGTQEHDGIYDMEGILMSFHPQKNNPKSSEWFHKDDWLTFNSVQACPSDQEGLIRTDYHLDPVKPTWLFEGRYEHYTYAYKPWHVRFQAYLSVFAGGFGHVYGNEAIWDFDPSWKTDIYWDGGLHMKYLNYILTEGLDRAKFGDLRPDTLILANNDPGSTSNQCWTHKTLEAPYSSRIATLASSDYSTVLVYSADGSTIELKHALLPSLFKAYWYNPRTGRFSEKKEINHKQPLNAEQFSLRDSVLVFDFPGEPGFDNDWILLLEK